jgi:hypothetical protein
VDDRELARELAQARRVAIRLEGDERRRRTAERAAAQRAGVKLYPPPVGVLSSESNETQSEPMIAR